MMNILNVTPYQKTENISYDHVKLEIRNIDFDGIGYQGGKSTIVFENCSFKKLEIVNYEHIDFQDILISFYYCNIVEIKIENFISKNCSIYFGSSVIDGRINNSSLKDININNCLINHSIFLIDVNFVHITYTEENVFLKKWNLLLKGLNVNFLSLLKESHSYHIYNARNISFSFNELNITKEGVYRDLYIPERLLYRLPNKLKDKFLISLNIYYSFNYLHEKTQIINGKLHSLYINGYSKGELDVQHTDIDNLYIHNFSSEVTSNFYDIKPYRKSEETKIEIHTSNLNRVWFDNLSFDSYSIISFYRNKYSQAHITSCEFPENYNGFEKFKTVENIHYPEKTDNNYYKIRFETFLQLKKVLENSGNFYEAQKLGSVSKEALMKIDNIQSSDKLILKINSLSNYHGLSIKKPICWILFFSILFYILYLWSLGRIFNSYGIDYNLVGYYFAFLDITHRSDFLADKDELKAVTLVIDYINKVLIGFLIYQFIAAFRKYGKQ